MDSCDMVFEHRLVDPDTVNWGRVMVICRILSMNRHLDKGGNGDKSGRPAGDLRERYLEWLNANHGQVEFDLAMRIVFDLTLNDPLGKMAERLGLNDEENPAEERVIGN